MFSSVWLFSSVARYTEVLQSDLLSGRVGSLSQTSSASLPPTHKSNCGIPDRQRGEIVPLGPIQDTDSPIDQVYRSDRGRIAGAVREPTDLAGWCHRTLFFRDPEDNVVEIYAEI